MLALQQSSTVICPGAKLPLPSAAQANQVEHMEMELRPARSQKRTDAHRSASALNQ